MEGKGCDVTGKISLHLAYLNILVAVAHPKMSSGTLNSIPTFAANILSPSAGRLVSLLSQSPERPACNRGK